MFLWIEDCADVLIALHPKCDIYSYSAIPADTIGG